MAVDDGGAAFPLSRENEGWFNGGMTLRDYLAGQALAGMLAYSGVNGGTLPVKYAKAAYGLADAMLAERKRET